MFFKSEYHDANGLFSLLCKPKTLYLPIVAALFTFWCYQSGIIFALADVTRFFFIGIFFCFWVIINTADQRRLEAFWALARMKSLLMTYWQISLSYKLSDQDQIEAKKIISSIIPSIKFFLRQEDSHLSAESFWSIDYNIYKLTQLVELLRKNGMASPEISRLYQLIQLFASEYETIVSIKEYRTPKILRDFLKAALIISIFVLAPDFAQIWWYGIFVSALIWWFFSSLIVIQAQIEYPFRNHIDDFHDEYLDRFNERVEILEKNLK